MQDAVKSKSSDIWVVSSTWFKKGKKKGPGPSHTELEERFYIHFSLPFHGALNQIYSPWSISVSYIFVYVFPS